MPLKFLNEDTGAWLDAVFCFTGKSPKTRTEMQAIAINAGASVTKTVTRGTTILVIADANSTSSKATKAREIGIDLISPEQFFDMCNYVTQSNAVGNISQVRVSKPPPVEQTPEKKNRHSTVRKIVI